MLTRTPQIIFTAAVLTALPFASAQQRRPQPPKSVRLYVLDCGDIKGANRAGFGFQASELATTDMITPCFLIVHPRGTLIWDTGEVADSDFTSNPAPIKRGSYTVTKPLLPQLAALGYTAADITYLGLSHYHGDHVANANSFAGSTWLVQQVERDAMFAPRDPGKKGGANPDLYGELRKSKATVINNRDHDVFGDGTVVIKFTPGHTPGHQALFLKLAKTGPVVLSGDLYHYHEEITLKRVPTFEFNKEQTMKSRAELEDFVKKNRAQLWIQHDASNGAKLKKAPEFYE